jgi:hypothetical protein
MIGWLALGAGALLLLGMIVLVALMLAGPGGEWPRR